MYIIHRSVERRGAFAGARPVGGEHSGNGAGLRGRPRAKGRAHRWPLIIIIIIIIMIIIKHVFKNVTYSLVLVVLILLELSVVLVSLVLERPFSRRRGRSRCTRRRSAHRRACGSLRLGPCQFPYPSPNSESRV